jgi:hypothetical protein
VKCTCSRAAFGFAFPCNIEDEFNLLLRTYGVFFRIPCEYKKNLTVRVEYEGSKEKTRSHLAVRFLYQSGLTDIAAVQVAQQQQVRSPCPVSLNLRTARNQACNNVMDIIYISISSLVRREAPVPPYHCVAISRACGTPRARRPALCSSGWSSRRAPAASGCGRRCRRTGAQAACTTRASRSPTSPCAPVALASAAPPAMKTSSDD